MTRHFWVLFHRYAGLFMAFFLIVIGLTGSIIVFNSELDHWLNPPPQVVLVDAPLLNGLELRERAQALVPQAVINSVALSPKQDEAVMFFIQPPLNPVTGKPMELGFDAVYLDPHTGQKVGQRKFNQELWPIDASNVMMLINRLHYQMALPGMIGTWLFGIVALVWTLDCFVSGYLTFPVSVRRSKKSESATTNLKRRSWWSHWWNPSWLVKWRGSTYRINFDLHRAGGLWVWFMLLALAWSSVGFNLSEEVYQPVMKAVFNMPNLYDDIPNLAKPQPEPALSWRSAHTIAQNLMAKQAKINSSTVVREESLQYVADKGVFIYSVRTDRDLIDEGGSTYLTLDGNSGNYVGILLPTGQNAGSTINSWINALHMAQIWGLPFRIFVTVVGILIAMLSITGFYTWLKKHNARRASQEKRERLEVEVIA